MQGLEGRQPSDPVGVLGEPRGRGARRSQLRNVCPVSVLAQTAESRRQCRGQSQVPLLFLWGTPPRAGQEVNATRRRGRQLVASVPLPCLPGESGLAGGALQRVLGQTPPRAPGRGLSTPCPALVHLGHPLGLPLCHLPAQPHSEPRSPRGRGGEGRPLLPWPRARSPCSPPSLGAPASGTLGQVRAEGGGAVLPGAGSPTREEQRLLSEGTRAYTPLKR